jgi:hypothetical protein
MLSRRKIEAREEQCSFSDKFVHFDGSEDNFDVTERSLPMLLNVAVQ